LVVGVADDGEGFGPETAVGVGLQSMNERADEVGGELRIDSQPGQGTRVRGRSLTSGHRAPLSLGSPPQQSPQTGGSTSSVGGLLGAPIGQPSSGAASRPSPTACAVGSLPPDDAESYLPSGSAHSS
jgi:hypothetical protein